MISPFFLLTKIKLVFCFLVVFGFSDAAFSLGWLVGLSPLIVSTASSSSSSVMSACLWWWCAR